MILKVRYATFDEPLKAVLAGKGLARLTEPSVHAPLTEGDVVTFGDDGVVTGVAQPTPHFIVEAFLPLLCDQWQLDERVERWGAATLVVQSSACTLRVRSVSWDWLVDVVEGDPEIELMNTLRRPGEFLDLAAAVLAAGGPPDDEQRGGER